MPKNLRKILFLFDRSGGRDGATFKDLSPQICSIKLTVIPILAGALEKRLGTGDP